MAAEASEIHNTSAAPKDGAIENPLGANARGNSLATSLVVAGAVAASLAWAHTRGDAAMPGFWAVALFLVVIAQQDTHRRKIPNWASGCGLLAAIALQSWQLGVSGLTAALIGIVVPFALLFAPYAARLVGAGDVKAFMVLGGFWGVQAVLGIAAWTVLVAGVMGFALVIMRGELIAYFRRWGRMARMAVMGGGARYEAPGEQDAASIGLPVGTAIGFATAVHLILGAPWQ